MDTKTETTGLRKLLYKLFTSISFLLLLWSISFYLTGFTTLNKTTNIGELATLLFGATSIALFMFSIIITVLAFFGWQEVTKRMRRVDELDSEFRVTLSRLESDVRNQIGAFAETNQKRILDLESAVREKLGAFEKLDRERLGPLEDEMRGRVASALGYILGELSINRSTLEVYSSKRLNDAILYCQQAYDSLRKINKQGAEFLAINNLVYYLCAARDASRKDFILEQARRIKTAAQEHSATDLLLTASLAIILYGEPREKAETILLLQSIAGKETTPQSQRDEANFYMNLDRSDAITLDAVDPETINPK